MDIIQRPEFENIYQVDCFTKEFKSLFGKNLQSCHRYEKWLIRKLKILDKLGIQATNGYVFEKIENNLFSIRSPESEHNPRVLYTIYMEENDVILLGAFLEENSSDYDIAKKKARKRIRILGVK